MSQLSEDGAQRGSITSLFANPSHCKHANAQISTAIWKHSVSFWSSRGNNKGHIFAQIN